MSGRARSVARLLPIEALTPDGLLLRSDGTAVRYLQVVPGNPLVLDAEGCARMTRGFTELLHRVPAGQAVQAYVQARPVPLADTLGAVRRETDAVTAPLVASDDEALRARGIALRKLAACHEESLRLQAGADTALALSYLLAVPYRLTASGGVRPHRGRTGADLAQLAEESWRHTERLRSALTGLDRTATVIDGPAVADLLWSRCSPDAAATWPDHAPSRWATALMHPLESARPTRRRTEALRRAICQSDIAAGHDTLAIDRSLERSIYLAGRPERTFYGWLLHAMQSRLPWTLSVHIHVRDRTAERARLDRRATRLWGLNEGALDRRSRPDRAQHEQQAELEHLVAELSSGAETICDVSIYQTLRAPAEARHELDDAVTQARHDLGTVIDARVAAGPAPPLDVWTSSLPLALDTAGRRVALISRNAADCMPFVSTSPGSPTGLPFAHAAAGRTIEHLDPFDRLHDNSTALLFAKSGGGKTMTSIALATAAIPRGCQVHVIDRSTGHWQFPCTLIPGAAHLELGDEDGPTVNPWDTDDPANVPRTKIAYLVRLHALMIGDHDAGTDTYGLGALERNLLALAIRTAYDRAAAERIAPRESLLHATLHDLADREAANGPGAGESAATYRNLAHRLSEYCAGGTYGYLFDRETTVRADDAPLVVFNTAKVPEDIAAPLLFCVLEFITRRVERRYARHEQRLAAGYVEHGPFDGTSAVIVEELWKLIERRATGAWVNELAKRARHIGLWLIAINQQRAELAGPQGQALLENATIQLFLRNGSADIAHVAKTVGLSGEELDQIQRLSTEKGSHAQAYLVNGERGRGAITIRHGPRGYWLATSEPHADVPRRNRALAAAGIAHARTDAERSAAAFRALDDLADQPRT